MRFSDLLNRLSEVQASGGLGSTALAHHLGQDPELRAALTSGAVLVVLAALLGAIAWNLITWWFGLPSSSSHALIGGLAGAALAASQVVHWNDPEVAWYDITHQSGILGKVLIPMIVSPLVGFTLAYGLAMAIIWTFRNAKREKSVKGFKAAQATASTLMAVGHGLQDAQKTMGVITLALIVGGYQAADDDGRLCPALPGRRRCLARAGAPL